MFVVPGSPTRLKTWRYRRPAPATGSRASAESGRGYWIRRYAAENQQGRRAPRENRSPRNLLFRDAGRRVNFSHSMHEYHQETLDSIRQTMHNTGILCAVMLDIKPHLHMCGASVDYPWHCCRSCLLGRGSKEYKPNPWLSCALDLLFILHAEHEMNCSAAAVRHLASRDNGRQDDGSYGRSVSPVY